MWTYDVHMKTATLRDLRNDFGKLENWLKEGEEVRIHRRNRLVAVLSAPPPDMEMAPRLPDFGKRRRETGLKPLDESALEAVRRFEREGEEG